MSNLRLQGDSVRKKWNCDRSTKSASTRGILFERTGILIRMCQISLYRGDLVTKGTFDKIGMCSHNYEAHNSPQTKLTHRSPSGIPRPIPIAFPAEPCGYASIRFPPVSALSPHNNTIFSYPHTKNTLFDKLLPTRDSPAGILAAGALVLVIEPVSFKQSLNIR